MDGDTVDLDVELGFYTTARIRFRLAGVDAPEVRGESKQRGLSSKEWVLLKLGNSVDNTIKVKSFKTGKYGRWLGDIYYLSQNGLVNMNEEIISEGFAKRYLK